MIAPDATSHDPCPLYLRVLIERAGLSQRAAARRLGLSERVMRYYLSPTASLDYRAAPYVVQYALEMLAITRRSRTVSAPGSVGEHTPRPALTG